jgi:hypothetical protein
MLSYFQNFNSVLPITVIFAILIFFTKEAFELIRRYISDTRKLKAIKHLISRDLELCAWTIKCYRNLLNSITIDDEHVVKYRVYTNSSGGMRYQYWTDDDLEDDLEDTSHFKSGGMFPPVIDTFATKFMLELATLDNKFYLQVEKTADALAELQHIKSSIIEQAEMPLVLRNHFIDYAKSEIDDIEVAINSLYELCTGKAEVKMRLR